MGTDNTPLNSGIKKIIYISLDELYNHSCVVQGFFILQNKFWVKYMVFKIKLDSEIILN
jgi:hypothetical protein